MNPNNDLDKPGAAQFLQGMRAHLEAAITLARQALAAAEPDERRALQPLFDRCVHELERARADAHSLSASLARGTASTPGESGEQVSAATFAPGDGANDAEVTPDTGRGKPGNWPAY
jgi:hypothetical protein